MIFFIISLLAGRHDGGSIEQPAPTKNVKFSPFFNKSRMFNFDSLFTDVTFFALIKNINFN